MLAAFQIKWWSGIFTTKPFNDNVSVRKMTSLEAVRSSLLVNKVIQNLPDVQVEGQEEESFKFWGKILGGTVA